MVSDIRSVSGLHGCPFSEMMSLCKVCSKLRLLPAYEVLQESIQFKWRSSCRFLSRSPCASGWKQNIMKQDTKEDVVFQYAGKNPKRADRIYVWGYAATGALGVKKFLRPEKNVRARKTQLNPHRLSFFDNYKMKVFKVAAGYGFTVFLCKTDEGPLVYGCGINTDSQLGYQEYPVNSGRILDYLVEPASISLPFQTAANPPALIDVSCGRAHTLIATDNQGVWSLGHNGYGQCGRTRVNDEIYRGSQQLNRVELPEKVVKVVCGQDHSLFLTENGELYSCGLGADGQTGLGHYDCVGVPQKVQGDIEGEKIITMACKADSVLAVSESGDVFGFGNSEYNQLSAVCEDETQVNTARRLPFTDVGKVTRVAAAGAMCALLNDQGEVYVWGFGPLGKGPKLSKSPYPQLIPPLIFGCTDFTPDNVVVDINSGLNYFTALTDHGILYSWGCNRMACLGLGNVLDHFFPFKVQVPAEVKQVGCGVDHMTVLTKAFA